MSVIDETHDPRRESWVVSARGHAEFPIQNLPFGVFSPAGVLSSALPSTPSQALPS